MQNLLVLNADKDIEAREYARTIGGVLAGTWFKKEGIVDMHDKSLTDRVNNADAMVMSQYDGSLTWYLVNTGGNLVVRDLVSPSRVKALYFMIEINVEMYWDRSYIAEELEEILAQASFGGTAGKRRVTERYYKMLTYIAHMEDNGNDDNFVTLEDIGTNANKDLIASRILKYKEILSAKVDW